MLTQSDLQAIGKIIGSLEVKMDLFEVKMGSFERKLGSLDKKTSRGFKAVDKKLDVIIDYFDHQDIDIRKRFNRIEVHLALAPLNS